MIDTHVHVVAPQLPGVGILSPLLRRSPEEVAASIREEMESAGMTHALAMGCLSTREDDPLGIAVTQRIAERVPGLFCVGVADPNRPERDHLARVEAQLSRGRAVALKGYLGYLHHFPDDPGYRPYFELAEKFDIPFIFHTGDTYSPYAKLRYAHPLGVDEVAVDHPDVKFVIAHLGNPWVLDAAEVVAKNFNVWVDLSGIVVGEPAGPAAEEAARRIGEAFRFAGRPNRFLYGSDWPLSPMRGYRDFILRAIPDEHRAQVFEENAARLFRLS